MTLYVVVDLEEHGGYTISGVYDKETFKKIYEQFVVKLYTNKWYWQKDTNVLKITLNSEEMVSVEPEDIK